MNQTKDIIKNVKRQPAEWEKVSTNHISDNDLVTRIYKKLLQLNNKRTTTQFKTGQRT